MTGRFGTDLGAMQATATKVDTVAQAMETRVRTLRGQMEATQGVLVGRAADAYRQTMADWDALANTFNQSLRTISELTRVNGRSFQAGDEDSASTFARSHISDALGGRSA